ncbi:MAG TPA: STAS domain-containing protein [Mycobacteriales bacterium]|jgi:anti-sigma B factor antagonist|nr:STAS domain-containing protein [Mycobacteriales bacterium]
MSTHAPGSGTETGPLTGSASVLTFGGVTTVLTSGEFDVATSDGLREALELACAKGTDVVVDMTGVTFMDGSGLRQLERAAAKLIPQGRSMRISNAPRAVVRLLQAAGTIDMLHS